MRRKLLIVEDTEEIIEALKVTVLPGLSATWDVTIAVDYGQAAQCLKSTSYDLVVTDFQFPGGDGNLVASLAREAGHGNIWLHTSDVENPAIVRQLFTEVFKKFERPFLAKLKAA